MRKPASWPVTIQEVRAAEAEPQQTWSKAEVDSARGECTERLKGLDVVVVEEPPIREGACGAPAPVRLISIGKRNRVGFAPEPILTCDMVAALAVWIDRDLQSLAKKHLGSVIVRVDTMSDYSCRNAYGRKKTKLSEHGRANALDIRGFVTASGQDASVLAGWGKTEREFAAERAAAERALAAAKAAPAAPVAGAAGQAAAGAPPAPTRAPAPPSTDDQRSTVAGAAASAGRTLGKIVGDGLLGDTTERPPTVTFTQPYRLGGPREKQPGAIDQMRFMREAHVAGCKIFGTILGPEANDAHKNHFHVDMAERTRSNFCE